MIRNAKSRGRCDRKLYKAMREKGIENWDMIPLTEVWLGRRDDLRDLEKYYIRLLEPDLNTRDGSKSDEDCERQRKNDSQLWTCPTCLTVLRVGNKANYRQTRYHKAIDSMLFELD